MKIAITQAQLMLSPGLSAAMTKKMIDKADFDAHEISHSEIQYCLDNGIALDKARLYSLVRTEAQMSELVPIAWPNSTDIDEEENETRVDWFIYCNYATVDGGYCILYTGGRVDAHKNHTLPSSSQLLAWIAKFGGFLTKPEVDAILVTNPGE